MILTPVSRMYLGAHSGNQILMGLTNGMCMAVIYRYFLQNWMYKLLQNMNKQKKRLHIAILALANIIAFIIPIIIFNITNNGT
jgi:hypothetical protein